jgi:hypothetical protein
VAQASLPADYYHGLSGLLQVAFAPQPLAGAPEVVPSASTQPTFTAISFKLHTKEMLVWKREGVQMQKRDRMTSTDELWASVERFTKKDMLSGSERCPVFKLGNDAPVRLMLLAQSGANFHLRF